MAGQVRYRLPGAPAEEIIWVDLNKISVNTLFTPDLSVGKLVLAHCIGDDSRTAVFGRQVIGDELEALVNGERAVEEDELCPENFITYVETPTSKIITLGSGQNEHGQLEIAHFQGVSLQ